MVANAMNDEPLPVYGDGRNVRELPYLERRELLGMVAGPAAYLAGEASA